MNRIGAKTSILLLCFIFLTIHLSVAQQDSPRKEKNEKREEGQKKRPRVRVNLTELYGNTVLGVPTDRSIILNTIAQKGATVQIVWGIAPSKLKFESEKKVAQSDGPLEFQLTELLPNTTYFYQVKTQLSGAITTSQTSSFSTAKGRNQSFCFGLQGDSHPEREGKMFSPALYDITLQQAKSAQLDFYLLMGDDFSIDHIIQKGEITKKNIDEVYLLQRKYLSNLGSSTPLFLVNGNHEQAAKCLLDGTAVSPSVLAAKARKAFFPLPNPEGFYSGDQAQVEHVGLLKDYYAYEWGDALFVVIDPYWHSEMAVDNTPGDRNKRTKDGWNSTLGKEQYEWFCRTLAKSKAKFKFVFAHHVLGTGRGGIELAKLYEWGGYNKRGEYEFSKMRPDFAKPIHQVMVENKVTIFFQGHDHLYCKQELDGVIYQSVPIPADNSYQAFNADAYLTGKTLPNAGFLKVTVSPSNVKVDYIRSYLPADQPMANDTTNYSYILKK